MKSAFDLEYQNKNVSARIVAALERISEAFRVLLWDVGKKFKLTPIQVQILIFLQTHTNRYHTVSYLAKEFSLTKATVSDAIATLEQKSLITKKKNKVDTRSYTLTLTTRGKRIAQDAALLTKAIEKPFKAQTKESKETILISLLNTIGELNKAGIITIQRMCLTCTYYEKNFNGNQNYCRLLEKKLHNSELRLDCNEHQQR
ncbi:MAG: MarR family winged helix-turn-helix transcriptional regulator [Ignavibacteria bacterium]